ncbi:heme-binding protein 2 isoform X2 [Syngnathoides biaculeatus]|uniref:heme-binding protein 2 isoform X2 n=1 Tax=Syngnathoides biaculeatus TaxID=300417 RepID=UPI002ADE4F25|nr:heme-binding protein 2 isoform X2 [Syngnathoides biaculeatus]
MKPEDYEIRTYVAAKWVSTSLSGTSLDQSVRMGFRRLFSYIQGNNDKNVKVEMTAPVTCRVDPGAGPACESRFTVSFFIPEEHRAAPPPPSDPDVFVENREEFTAYVRSYGGFSNETLARAELLQLLRSLQRDGVDFVERPYYVAGYDSPFRRQWHRRCQFELSQRSWKAFVLLWRGSIEAPPTHDHAIDAAK